MHCEQVQNALINHQEILTSKLALSNLEKKGKRWPHYSIQFPENGKWRGKCQSYLPGYQWYDMCEQHKEVPGDAQTGH